jgi:hypothetical protein
MCSGRCRGYLLAQIEPQIITNVKHSQLWWLIYPIAVPIMLLLRLLGWIASILKL